MRPLESMRFGAIAPLLAAAIVGLASLPSRPAAAAEWSDTEVNYKYGTRFREPSNPSDVTKNILTLQHASGHKYGRNFFFVDFLKSDGADDHAGEVYGEWYSSLSLSKLTGRNLPFGIVRDLNLTGGINYGAKNTGANPRVFLPGITVDFDVPGFAFFRVAVLAYVDRGNFKPDATTTLDNCGKHATSYQIVPAWQAPFSLGPTKWSFEGHVDFTGSRGTCQNEIFAQPQLRFDVGHFFGKPDTVFAGVEYQYWRNKFGFKGLNESLPQLLLVWKF